MAVVEVEEVDDMIDAARKGSISTLYALLEQDRKRLDHIDSESFVETPLHMAAAAGSTHFAIEMMSLKPSFSRKLNPSGFSPLDLALQNQKFDTVRRLIHFDSELIRVKGKERCTPLHHVAAREGQEYDDLLATFLFACPGSIYDVNVRGQTALHVAVRYGNIGAFKILLGWLQRTGRKQVLNIKDEDGNTVLHVAASYNQLQVVKLLEHKIKMNAQNLEGLTAYDIAALNEDDKDNRQVRNILFPVGPLEHLRPSFSKAEFLGSPEGFLEKVFRYTILLRKDLSMDMRNVVLVVAALIVTTTYQAILHPPGGFSQSGKMLMDPHSFYMFMPVNTIAFTASIGVILFVVQLRIYTVLLYISLFCLMYSYIVAIDVISESTTFILLLVFSGWILFSIFFNVRLYVFPLKHVMLLLRYKWFHRKLPILVPTFAWYLFPACIIRLVRRREMQWKLVGEERDISSINKGKRVLI